MTIAVLFVILSPLANLSFWTLTILVLLSASLTRFRAFLTTLGEFTPLIISKWYLKKYSYNSIIANPNTPRSTRKAFNHSIKGSGCDKNTLDTKVALIYQLIYFCIP